MAKLVILESPFAGPTLKAIEENVAYARRCARRCAQQGEATQASHLYYTQFLDDNVPEERALGMSLGLAWIDVADYSVFFTDRGWSNGMLAALHKCASESRKFFIRALDDIVKLPSKTSFPYALKLSHKIDMERGVYIGTLDKQ